MPSRKREYRNLPVARKKKKSTGIEANHSDLKIGYLLELENVLRGRFLSREIADARTVSIPIASLPVTELVDSTSNLPRAEELEQKIDSTTFPST